MHICYVLNIKCSEQTLVIPHKNSLLLHNAFGRNGRGFCSHRERRSTNNIPTQSHSLSFIFSHNEYFNQAYEIKDGRMKTNHPFTTRGLNQASQHHIHKWNSITYTHTHTHTRNFKWRRVLGQYVNKGYSIPTIQAYRIIAQFAVCSLSLQVYSSSVHGFCGRLDTPNVTPTLQLHCDIL